jgi:hypothetical protein
MLKGLQSRFLLVDGKFNLTSGVEKHKDSIWFYCVFDTFRIYASDFGAKFVNFLQKPASFFVMNRTLIIGNLQKGIKKYIPGVSIKTIDVGYFANDRTEYHLKIEYTSTDDKQNKIDDVTFV